MGRAVLVLHGPNLDRLGTREPAVYGTATLPEIDASLVRLGEALGVGVTTLQTNHEGVAIDRIWAAADAGVDGLLVNAGGWTHTSVALRDALAGCGRPFVEVHLSNVAAREPFRHASLLAPVAAGVVTGFGAASYELGLRGLCAVLDRRADA
ncbi:MAG: type II 3-dehydroquinate dehydratase [Myxococcota bacterium]